MVPLELPASQRDTLRILMTSMNNRLGREARSKQLMRTAVYLVLCVKSGRRLAHSAVITALVEPEVPVAFEVPWIFSEIPVWAAEKGPGDFPGGSQTGLPAGRCQPGSIC